MSRLQRHRRKQFAFSIVFFITLFVLVLVFIFTYGFKLLLNSSLFVANIANKNDPNATPTKNNLIETDINIDDIPIATNSAKIIVRGTAPNYKKLTFYINEEPVKELDLSKDIFSEEIGNLKEGENSIYIKGTAKDSDKIKQSSTYSVIYKKEKPKLEIQDPQDKATVNTQDISVLGQTDRDIMIKINDLPVVVSAEGTFQTSVRLKEGENKIKIEAIDNAGNIEKKEITVTYSKE